VILLQSAVARIRARHPATHRSDISGGKARLESIQSDIGAGKLQTVFEELRPFDSNTRICLNLVYPLIF